MPIINYYIVAFCLGCDGGRGNEESLYVVLQDTLIENVERCWEIISLGEQYIRYAMERQEHNQGLKDTFTEEFGEWENCINATIKETPKHKFIRSLPGCNSREIDSGKPPFHKSALKKPDITNKADKKFKAKAEMEKMERIRKLSDILQQYNTLVDKRTILLSNNL